MILLKNNYYEEDEKLFSTGNEELDNILEEVYYSGISDGYDYFQKEFAKKEKEKRSGAEKVLNTAAGGSVAVSAALTGKMLKDRLALAGEHKTKESMDKAIETAKSEAKEIKVLLPKVKALENKPLPKDIDTLTKHLKDTTRLAELETKTGNSAHKYVKSSKNAKIALGTTAGLMVAAGGAKYLRKRKERNDSNKN